MTHVNGEARLAIPEPDFDDYELAVRSLSGGRLRPDEEARLDSPVLLEARFRIEHMMRSQVAAARASMAALGPAAAKRHGELIETAKDEVALGAIRLWGSMTLPPEPVAVSHLHTHTLGEEEKALAGQAAADFSRLTNELSHRITGYQTIDISTSKHLLRGDDARPMTTRLERPAQAIPVPVGAK